MRALKASLVKVLQLKGQGQGRGRRRNIPTGYNWVMSDLLYETDFAEWSARTAALIRAGRFGEIDAESVAEEIETLGKSERHAVHKIKQIIRPERDCASWQVSIESSRTALRDRLRTSPSLRRYLQQNFQEIYEDAAKLAVIETGTIEDAPVPKKCPWDLDVLLQD
jgi:hypothetical protein